MDVGIADARESLRGRQFFGREFLACVHRVTIHRGLRGCALRVANDQTDCHQCKGSRLARWQNRTRIKQEHESLPQLSSKT